MTAQVLSSELSNLIQESKRKNSELRTAAEKSLEELKALRSTTEQQTAADLSQHANFVTPFLIACGTKNAKFTGIAIVCLQRLAASRALPRSRLKEVLEAFREASSSGLDVQLKILQSLPSMLHNYAEDIKGDKLASALNVCSTLQSSKNGIVNNTAAATLQQLVVAVFDKVVVEDKISLEVPTVGEVSIENGTVHVRAAAFDAYRVFDDICLMTEQQKPSFLKFPGLPQTFGLELIESVLMNHAEIFLTHPEQADILRTRVMPFILSSLSGRLSFATTVRIVRILYTLLRRHLGILATEGEMALGLLTSMLDPDTALWKRALCMEVLRGLFAEAALVRQIFSLYDAQPEKKNILGDIVATFVRLSSEKPSIIGLGSQSTLPSGNQFNNNSSPNDQAVLEASGIPGIIGSSLSNSETSVGISMQWSSMRVPCIDQLDKADPPAIPESYIYGLALTCINSFSEGLAKFILPLTVPKDPKPRKKPPRISNARDNTPEADGESSGSSMRQPIDRAYSFKKNPVPLNPLELVDHPLYEDVKTCAAIVDRCWPAILATCSTFLYAALDAEYYHGLVRSFQKFTHVAGLLRLSTPRDAYLTTLGKAAVPPNVFKASNTSSAIPATPTVESQGIFSNARGLLSVDSLASNSQSTESRRMSTMSEPLVSLNTRNLLCLRALLNLGIALGPTLNMAWLIVLENLQQADFILFSASRGTRGSSATALSKADAQNMAENSALMLNFGNEIKAVETAASRLFESTVDFPNESFVDVVSALCRLFASGALDDDASSTPGQPKPATPTQSRKPSFQGHNRGHSMSMVSTTINQEDLFALAKLGDVASINIDRLMAYSPEDSGWTSLTSELIIAMTSTKRESPIRIRAAEILVRVILEAASATMSFPDETRGEVQRLLLDTLQRAILPLQDESRVSSVSTSSVDVDVHKIILDGLKSILEQCGETLINGWDIAFKIMGSVFVAHRLSTAASTSSALITRSSRLIRSSFGSLQLICSDFLSSLPRSCFLILVDTLYNFCTQDDDLNICLTTVTFFWVLSDFISNRAHSFTLTSTLINAINEETLNKAVDSNDDAKSSAALWMLLLLRLTVVTTDERLELRNGAIQTLLRIFDAYGDQLSPEAWTMCIQSVIFRMFSSMEMRLGMLDSTVSIAQKDKGSWVETTVVVLNGVADLLSTYLHVLTKDANFKTCWQNLMDHFTALLKIGNLEINTALFKGIRQILSHANTEAEEQALLDQDSIRLIYELWSRGLPLSSSESKASNQPCLVAYVSTLREIYRLIKEDINVEQIQCILNLLRDTIARANVEAYSADIEYLTVLQTQVLESLKMIRTDIKGVPAAMITQVADLTTLPFQERDESQSDKQRPTYIALSKASMTFLESLILTHASDIDVYTTGAVTAAITALSRPLTLKYAFPITIKTLSPWRQATTSSVSIIAAILPVIAESTIPSETTRSLWSAIVTIANGIVSADSALVQLLPPSTIASDQEFDISSFTTLRNLITPSLGNQVIPDKTRRSYTDTLFRLSFIHCPPLTDFPLPNQDLLSALSKPRKGRTVDPPPSLRKKMSYICLEELFNLVSVQSSTPEQIKLAQAAAPYLILRTGLTFKAYIADQPLRGLMPQPLSQRKELLWLLRNLVELECEKEAIPESEGVVSDGRRHLVRLFGLLVNVGKAGRRDGEVTDWVGRCLDVIGGEFGV